MGKRSGAQTCKGRAFSLWIVSILMLVLCLPARAQGQDQDSVRVFRLGNSHTNSIRDEFLGVVGAAGHRNFVHDQHTVPGAPIWWLYDRDPEDSVEKLKNNPWDVVIFQTYNSTNETEKKAIVEYTRAAREGNPKVRVILYTIWPARENWDNPSYGRTEAWTEEVADRLRREFSGLDVAVAPTSLIIRRISDLADQGLIPGMAGHNDLYQDAGHMGLYGGYAIGSCFTVMIFQESPIGYPHQMLEYGREGFTDEVKFQVDPKAASAIQKIIWDVLAEYDQGGLDTGLWIRSGRMRPAIVGRRYDRQIPVASAAAEPEFKLVAGALPAGVSLRDGRLVGTPTTSGLSRFTLRADDGKKTVEREMVLAVEKDLPLSIVDYSRRLAADDYVMDELKAKGAVGVARWKVVDGELPAGLTLKQGGLIMGTPAEEGEFELTVRAEDDHPDGPRSAEGTVTFTVGPPSEGTIRVPTREATTETGKPLGEQDLSSFSFDNVIEDSEGNVVARFAVSAYKGDERYRKRHPDGYKQLLVLVKVYEENAEGFPMESVHLYLDTNHNREVIYNSDDEHWCWRGKPGPDHVRRVKVHCYRPTRLVRSTYGELDGGWMLGVTHAVPTGFGVHHWSLPVTYGFNLAVGSEKDPEKRYYWRGDARSDKDTSVFGSILVKGARGE